MLVKVFTWLLVQNSIKGRDDRVLAVLTLLLKWPLLSKVTNIVQNCFLLHA